MGNSSSEPQMKFDKNKMCAALRMAMSRINIHRGKKLNMIAKRKDDIAKYLEAGNETNAKIWVETLINDESFVPCLDVVAVLCDQILGRVAAIEKFGVPPDMTQTISTLLYAAPRCEVDELLQIRMMLTSVVGREFVNRADSDPEVLNKLVRENIDMRMPEEGEKIKKLMDIAREKNIDYKPSEESLAYLNMYLERLASKGKYGAGGVPPSMLPAYPPPNHQAMNIPPPHNQPPPYFPPPPGGGGSGGNGGMPSYMQPQPHAPNIYGPPPHSYSLNENPYDPNQPQPYGTPVQYIPPPEHSTDVSGPVPPVNGTSPNAHGGSPTIVYPRATIAQDNSLVPPGNSENNASPQKEEQKDGGGDIDDFEKRLAALKRL